MDIVRAAIAAIDPDFDNIGTGLGDCLACQKLEIEEGELVSAIRKLQPEMLWQCFADLNEVPRPSKGEARVTEFMTQFGINLGLATEVDAVGNVLIRKPGTAGKEKNAPVVLQSHLDMVWQKNSSSKFDFENSGIEMRVDGDWVKAAETTLGADNGIGVAAIMAILAADDLEHPPLEALFTIDEETGMTGAKSLKAGWIKGKQLLNLDTEQDNELTIGCAGGVNVTAQLPVVWEPVSGEVQSFQLTVSGLTGGHSGMDIHLGRGNANKLMNRLLWQLAQSHGLRLSALNGGGLRNAIPRESTATVSLPTSQVAAAREWLSRETAVLSSEYSHTDPNLKIELTETAAPAQWLSNDCQRAVLGCVYACPNGIHRMTPTIASLVQSSNNLACVAIKPNQVEFLCLTRSSVDSERDDLARTICALFAMVGANAQTSDDYPGWQPDPQSHLTQTMSQLYRELFSGEPHVAACHAGLECGIIGSHYPGMQMISFGPNILGAHSPDERVQISSVQKFWRYLTETLKRL